MDLSAAIKLASEIAEDVVNKEAPEADASATWVTKSMEALKQSGLTGLMVPEDCGGMGHGLYALARISEILGKSYSSAGLCFGMHCVGTAVLAAKATLWQKQNYLVPIAKGQHITTLALSEPATGAHFYFPQTSLVQKNEKIQINGAKTFVTNGSHADSYVISTQSVDPSAGPDQFSCMILDASTKGISWGERWEGFGMRGNDSRSMTLDNLEVGLEHILGEHGDQLWYVFNVVAPYFLTAMAGTYLGVAGAAFDESIKALKGRTYGHDGTQLADNTVMQNKLGKLFQKYESAKALIYRAAVEGDHGGAEAVPLILAAKTAAAECAVDLANEAMSISGGRGYSSNSHLGMLLRDARAAHVMSPTTDMLYTWIGRALLDQPLLSD